MSNNPNELFGAGGAARQLGISRWKLQYYLDRGDLPAVGYWVENRRIFAAEDIERLRHALDALTHQELPVR